MRLHPMLLTTSLLLVACGTQPGTVHRVDEGALGPYSSSVRAGDFVFVSGKIGERGGTFAHEVETALDAVERELEAVGLTLGEVVEARVFLVDMGQYGELNEIYGRRFPAPYPARACVAVAALPGEARVEVQVVARRH